MSDKGRPEPRARGQDQYWFERNGGQTCFVMGDSYSWLAIHVTPDKAREMARVLTEWADGRETALFLDVDGEEGMFRGALDTRGSTTFGPVTVFDDGEIRASATVSPSEIVGLVTAAITEGLKAGKITLVCSCPVESDALGFVRGVRQSSECKVHGTTPHPAVKALRAAEAIARADRSPSR